jgi:hypothetical protein
MWAQIGLSVVILGVLVLVVVAAYEGPTLPRDDNYHGDDGED